MSWYEITLVSAYSLCAVLFFRPFFWMFGMPRLAREPDRDDEDLPLLSVVVPACNEEATLEAAVKTLLGSRYPALEVVLVDDRSTDQTGALVDAIAAADPRVRAVHIQELPAGWLGKNHAMHVASQQVSGGTGPSS